MTFSFSGISAISGICRRHLRLEAAPSHPAVNAGFLWPAALSVTIDSLRHLPFLLPHRPTDRPASVILSEVSGDGGATASPAVLTTCTRPATRADRPAPVALSEKSGDSLTCRTHDRHSASHTDRPAGISGSVGEVRRQSYLPYSRPPLDRPHRAPTDWPPCRTSTTSPGPATSSSATPGRPRRACWRPGSS